MEAPEGARGGVGGALALFLCLPLAPPGQRAPRWGQVGSENKDQTRPWAPRSPGRQGISSQSALRDVSGHYIARLPRPPVWSRENDPKDRTVDGTHRNSVATIRFRALQRREQANPSVPACSEFSWFFGTVGTP